MHPGILSAVGAQSAVRPLSLREDAVPPTDEDDGYGYDNEHFPYFRTVKRRRQE
jgi:hypothetical protein